MNINKYLIHYGIIGQRWGVRRFQNKDGSLTSAGKQRYRYDDELIPKGTNVYRITNSDEKIDSYRKYGSITKNDRESYRRLTDKATIWREHGDKLTGELPLDYSKPISEYIYETKKDLRVVSGKKVVDDLLDKYGNISIDDKNTLKRFIHTEYQQVMTSPDTDYKIKSKYYSEFNKAHGLINLLMKDHGQDLMTNYKQEGYDAMIDYEDWLLGYQYPVIFLNPTDSLTLVKKENINKERKKSK